MYIKESRESADREQAWHIETRTLSWCEPSFLQLFLAYSVTILVYRKLNIYPY